MGTHWRNLVTNMENGTESRFTMEWYHAHPITQHLMSADIKWGKTLEIASGIGIRALLLRQQKDCPVIGIDIDDFAVEYSNQTAREKFGYTPTEAFFSKGSFYDIPFQDKFFDNVIFIAGLEHAFYPVKVLDEVERVIRPGGKMFISVTENNYHANPDHKSSWNEASLKRLLSSYGNVKTWVTDNIIFAILEFHKRLNVPQAVLCDLNITDSYTPYWLDAFNKVSKCEMVSLGTRDMKFAGPDISNHILDTAQNADLLFFGTGAAFENMDEICIKVKQANPNIVISKWFGDASDNSLQVDRYMEEVYKPSSFFDQVFMVDSKRIGQVSNACGQFIFNGLYAPTAIKNSISWSNRPIDVLCIINAYSKERLDNIKAFLPKEKFSYLWVGDGSFHGRMPRQISNHLYGLSKIVVNIVDTRHRSTRHWVSNRVYWAMASGALVFSSPIDGLEDVFDGGVVILEDDSKSWQNAYEEWLNGDSHQRVENIIQANQTQMEEFHTFDYKVYSILRHAGFCVSRVTEESVTKPPAGSVNQHVIDFDLYNNECILAQPISSLSAKIKVELGCGATKSPGFIGADRFSLPGVDLEIDLNKPLPFATNSVDLIYASHSLEHIDDLMFTMSEIYRICKHGAQICIVAPYFQQGLNLANPYHQQVFNEHTHRFWTNYHNVPVDKNEYDHPASYLWGLAESDNSLARIDLRMLRMEFFYFPEYRNMSVEAQRDARKKYIDVCDQIMYNLVVIKEKIEDDEMSEIVQSTKLYEPPYVTIRKIREALDNKEQMLSQSAQELEQTKQALNQSAQELEQTKQALNQSAQELEQTKQTAEKLVLEIDAMREKEILNLLYRFRQKSLHHALNPLFQKFLDDSFIFQDVRRFFLQPSRNLQKVDFIGYRLEFNRPGLSGIWLAPILEISIRRGMIGIELISPQKEIVLHKVMPASNLTKDMPVQFAFEPILNTQQGKWEIRVFVRDIDGPLRLFEWRRYSLGGFGKLVTRAFFAFDFE